MGVRGLNAIFLGSWVVLKFIIHRQNYSRTFCKTLFHSFAIRHLGKKCESVEKCIFKTLRLRSLKTLCKSDRACAHVPTESRDCDTHGLWSSCTQQKMKQKLSQECEYICNFSGSERVEDKINPCKAGTFHLEWNSGFPHITFNRNYHDKKCQGPIW